MIPSQSTITRRASYRRCRLSFFKKVVASSPPTRLPMKQECIVAGLSYGGLLAFCRPTDSSWTFIETKDLLKFKDIEILDGKLYAVTTVEQASAFLMVYDILPAHANGYRVHSKDSFRCYCGRGGPFLVKDSAANELFMILQKISFRHQSKNEKLFQVFKLDYCKTNGGPPWEEVVDLGDRMLFLSDASSMFIEDKTLGKNCIFFAINDEGAGCDDCAFGVHSLTDRNIKLLALPQDTSSTIINVFSRTLWFTPLPW
ncbi:uncharacterized protein LOC133733521 [Rosa rugosa]|uniref:uncharacterized protein LOC133733521 n=1 Tax=Rosa rugosa TaxID=74645 RepID=UPI002B4067F4|nr:uncharacterized protein LOC133733521 [Rosa rugosa]